MKSEHLRFAFCVLIFAFSFERSEERLGRPYPEVTAALLPSSLTRFHSFALVHLHSPTCVGFRYGFILFNSFNGFLGRLLT
jgi:hypothetical protein